MNMKDLKAEMQKLSGGATYIKRDFLLTLVIGLIVELPFRHLFIETVSKPLKGMETSESLSILIDCIFGYYIYLLEHEPNSLAFRRDAINDLECYLENDGDTLKTKHFIGYLDI